MTNPCRAVQFSTRHGTGARVEPSRAFWATHNAKSASEPVVLAVGANDRACLVGELPEPPVVRGPKHRARGLGSYATGHSGFLEIHAGYRHPGQATRGLCCLFCKLIDASIPAKWLVFLAQDVFESIWKRAAFNGSHVSLRGDDTSVSEVERHLKKFENEHVPEDFKKALVGSSPEMDLVRRQVVRAARLGGHVLIRGESGTGKEIVAEWIHRLSPRKDKPQIARNCGALPELMAESILFGHTKGSFTGATTRHPGLWANADGGTLHLDEIVELAEGVQVKFFRVLDSGKVAPLGGSEERTTNVRLICATNRNMEKMLEEGQLRTELYQRLNNMILIRTPSLRSRIQDLEPIADHLWKEITNGEAPAIPGSVKELLCKYSWPGNVRQLQGFLKQLYFRFDNQVLDREQVAAAMREWGYL